MAVFIIGDLHLSLGCEKPMDVFQGWQDYVPRLEKNWRALVAPQDTVVLAGDTSWGMKLEESLEDFRFLEALPGRKVLLKGNHDYWWTTAAKMAAFFEANGLRSFLVLHNQSVLCEDEHIALCGTRGWLAGQPSARAAQGNVLVFAQNTLVMQHQKRPQPVGLKKRCHFGGRCPPVVVVAFQQHLPARKRFQKAEIFQALLQLHAPGGIACKHDGILRRHQGAPVFFQPRHIVLPALKHIHGLFAAQGKVKVSNDENCHIIPRNMPPAPGNTNTTKEAKTWKTKRF